MERIISDLCPSSGTLTLIVDPTQQLLNFNFALFLVVGLAHILDTFSFFLCLSYGFNEATFVIH